MARRAFVRFRSDPDGPLDVAIADSKGDDVLPGELSDLKSTDDVVVFVPATDVGWHDITIPARNHREARRAAPFVIEDDLASVTDRLHVSVSPKTDRNTHIVLTCEDALMEAWIRRLRAEDISPAVIVPEFAVLPAEDCVIDLDERILLRINSRPMGLDGDGPFDLLRAVYASSVAEVSVFGSDLAQRLDAPLSPGSQKHPVVTLAIMAQQNDLAHDLRQGRFIDRQTLALSDLKTWQRPLLIAASAGVAWLGATAWETASLSEASRKMRAQASSLYASAFAEEGRIPDPATRTQAKLVEGAGRTLDFERTAAVLFQTLEAVDGARLRTLRYDGQNAEIQASVDYARYGDDLRLSESLSEAGLVATLGDTRASNTAITGDVTIRTRP